MERINLDRPGAILLISCYELGHQPMGLALPIAFLERAGFAVSTLDLAVEGLDESQIRAACFIGFSVPMHTALRLAVAVGKRVRELNPFAHVCYYGLYASLNSQFLLESLADSVIGGEFEETLTRLVGALGEGEETPVPGVATKGTPASPVLERLEFPVPARKNLLPLRNYARFQSGAEEFIAGYVESSRGCKHLCRHCPIPPVYGGRFFVVPVETVLGDVRQLVDSGARHITFGDPDFLNAPRHALRIAEKLHGDFPGLTFDFTAKVEHLLSHQRLLPDLARAGCVFIVSAVESLSDRVLENLRKGHSRSDVLKAMELLRESGIVLRPTWVPFTPWTTVEDYLEMLDFISEQDLIDSVDPVQYALRLLVPPGSYLLDREEMRPHLGSLLPGRFTCEWTHPDPRMDDLQKSIAILVEVAAKAHEESWITFSQIWELACLLANGPVSRAFRINRPPARGLTLRLSEHWFC